jgi:hypothetical protein
VELALHTQRLKDENDKAELGRVQHDRKTEPQNLKEKKVKYFASVVRIIILI